jgi:hypothetical protein
MLVKLSINQISGYLFEIAIINIIQSKPKQDQFKINQLETHIYIYKDLFKIHTHTHTHTHIYIYIYIYIKSEGLEKHKFFSIVVYF